ncbi:Fe-S cluster assembly protein SufD [Pseudolabrys sp. FHR47]|uniref:Fe-S cluster assembly protein SufD n=1 Tax=Pseudolabrys sp. FHR47 TaxID=2562284 RepID=UPI0010BF5B7C|nr:Fe-S cluster assembly protein SufD [Pseudolabrys sp. FHR47]
MNAEPRPLKTTTERALAEAYIAAKAVLPGDGNVAAQRAAAFDRFAASGLPHRRVERWKYTDLRNFMPDAKPLAAPPDATARTRAREAGQVLAGVECRRLFVVDGSFVADLSDLAGMEMGLSIQPMAEALASGDALVSTYLGKIIAVDDPALSLNTALMGDGVVIRVAAGMAIERPLHLVFISTSDKPTAMFTRSLIVIEDGARATLLETHEGPDQSPYQVNDALELVVGDDAQLDRVKITGEGTDAIHVATVLATVGARAKINDFSFTVGGAVVRNQLFVRLAGQDTLLGIRGASLLTRRQHVDTTLDIDHMASGCQSREVFKSVLDEEARSVFQGKISVRPQAQKTDGRMMTRALLLSNDAEADSKPELEIFADDVQCGHGSTAGALDEELKFYLMARGIPAKEAEAILIESFVGDVVDTIEHEGVRAALANVISHWLRQRG